MSDVFISYSRRDATFVHTLHDALAALNRDIWIDWEDIPLSSNWWQEICDGIEGADTFIFVITPAAAASPICNFEIAHALHHNKRILPVLRRAVDEQATFAQLTARRLTQGETEILANRDLIDVARHSWQAVARHNWVMFDDDEKFQQGFARLLLAVDSDLEHIREHTQLLVRAREWEKSGHEPGLLLSGRSIDEAERWLTQAQSKAPAPTQLHSEFILASRQRQRQSGRRILAGALTLTIVAVIAAIFAGFQTVAANDNAATAAANENAAVAARATSDRRALEAQSIQWAVSAQQAMNGGDQSTALTLALAAVRIPNPPAEAQRTLADVAYAPGRLRQLGYYHAGNITAAALNVDASRALTGASDGTLLLWDTQAGQPVRLMTVGTRAILSLAYLADGRRALAGNEDGSIVLWDVELGQPLKMFALHDEQVNAIAVHQDQKRVISSSCPSSSSIGGCDANQIVIWELDTGREQLRFSWAGRTVIQLAFGSDGKTAVGLYCAQKGDYTLYCEGGEVVTWNLESSAPGAEAQHGLSVGGSQRQPGGAAIDSTGQFTFELICEDQAGILFGPECSASQLRVLDTQTGEEMWRIADGPAFSSVSITVTAGGRYVLTVACVVTEAYGNACSQAELSLFDVETGTRLRVFDRPLIATGDAIFSPDGRRALLSSCRAAQRYDGCQNADLLLFDVESGDLLRVLNDGSRGMAQIAFSADGRMVIEGTCEVEDHTDPYSRCKRGKIVLWDVESGQIERTLFGHQSSVSALAISADGSFFLSAACAEMVDYSCQASEIIIWDFESSEPLRAMISRNKVISSLALSPDGLLALSGSGINDEDGSQIGGELTLWNLLTGEVERTMVGHTSRITDLVFTMDGQHALSSSADDTTILWDLTTGRPINTFADQNSSVTSVAFRPDGQAVLTANCASMVADGCIAIGALVLWDVERGVPLRTFAAQRNLTISLAFSADGRYALSAACSTSAITIACPFGDLTLWDMASGPALDTLYDDETINDFVFLDDQSIIITSGLNILDPGGSPVSRPMNLELEGIEAMALSRDRRWLFTRHCVDAASYGCNVYELALIDLEHHEVRWTIPGDGAIAVAADGQMVLADLCEDRQTPFRCERRKAIVRNAQTGGTVAELSGHRDPLALLGFSLDGKTAYSVDQAGVAALWDTQTWQLKNRVRVDLDRSGQALAVSPDGRLLVTTACQFERCESPELSIWDMMTGTLLRSLVGHSESIRSAAFNSDGTLLLSGGCHRMRGESCGEGEILMWDTANGDLLRVFVGHSTTIDRVAFTPDGKRAVSISGLCQFTMGGLGQYRTCAGSEIRIWRIDSLNELVQWAYQNRVVRELTCAERQRYGFEPACDGAIIPFRTPFLTWTPSPSPTTTPTSDFERTTATPTFTPLPQLTPSATRTPWPTPSISPEMEVPSHDRPEHPHRSGFAAGGYELQRA